MFQRLFDKKGNMFTERELDEITEHELVNEIGQLIEKFEVLHEHQVANSNILFAFFDEIPKFDELLKQYQQMGEVLDRKSAIFALTYPLEEYFLRLIKKLKEISPGVDSLHKIATQNLSHNRRDFAAPLFDGKSVVFGGRELAETNDDSAGVRVSVTSSIFE